jgi:hypothetical protein
MKSKPAGSPRELVAALPVGIFICSQPARLTSSVTHIELRPLNAIGGTRTSRRPRHSPQGFLTRTSNRLGFEAMADNGSRRVAVRNRGPGKPDRLRRCRETHSGGREYHKAGASDLLQENSLSPPMVASACNLLRFLLRRRLRLEPAYIFHAGLMLHRPGGPSACSVRVSLGRYIG